MDPSRNMPPAQLSSLNPSGKAPVPPVPLATRPQVSAVLARQHSVPMPLISQDLTRTSLPSSQLNSPPASVSRPTSPYFPGEPPEHKALVQPPRALQQEMSAALRSSAAVPDLLLRLPATYATTGGVNHGPIQHEFATTLFVALHNSAPEARLFTLQRLVSGKGSITPAETGETFKAFLQRLQASQLTEAVQFEYTCSFALAHGGAMMPAIVLNACLKAMISLDIPTNSPVARGLGFAMSPPVSIGIQYPDPRAPRSLSPQATPMNTEHAPAPAPGMAHSALPEATAQSGVRVLKRKADAIEPESTGGGGGGGGRGVPDTDRKSAGLQPAKKSRRQGNKQPGPKVPMDPPVGHLARPGEVITGIGAHDTLTDDKRLALQGCLQQCKSATVLFTRDTIFSVLPDIKLELQPLRDTLSRRTVNTPDAADVEFLGLISRGVSNTHQAKVAMESYVKNKRINIRDTLRDAIVKSVTNGETAAELFKQACQVAASRIEAPGGALSGLIDHLLGVNTFLGGHAGATAAAGQVRTE